jgi:uncharacterized OB-fold protein
VSDYKKPLPEIDEDSKPFWDAARRHEIVLHQCRVCGRFAPLQYPLGGTGCLEHGDANMEWVRVSGKGTLFSFVVFHQTIDPAFKDDLPYNVAMVELEEGPLLISNVIDCNNEDLTIGMPLEVVFEDITEEESLPKFIPVI